MVKLDRIDQPIFAGNNAAADDEIAVFGTMKTSAVYSMDLSTLLASPEYQKGWQNSVVVGYAPFLEEMNGVQYGFSYQIAYLQQQGIPEWSGTTTYYKGSVAKLINGSNAKVYVSKTDDNTGNLLSDTSKWKLWLDSSATYVKDSDLNGAISTVKSTDLTADRALISDTNGKITVSAVKKSELEGLVNITENVQQQLNGKQATIIGAATTIASNNLTASRAVISNSSGKVAVSAVTSTELGYLDGVTSNIQTQLNGKITATGSKSQNGYIKFSNGIIIQWGKGGTGTNTVVDLPTSFTNTNYSVTITSIGNSGVYQRTIATTGKTKDSFKTYAGGGAATDEFYWQAIGY